MPWPFQRTNVTSAKVVYLIQVRAVTGKGTAEDPVREVIEYFDFEGEKMAELDTWKPD